MPCTRSPRPPSCLDSPRRARCRLIPSRRPRCTSPRAPPSCARPSPPGGSTSFFRSETYSSAAAKRPDSVSHGPVATPRMRPQDRRYPSRSQASWLVLWLSCSQHSVNSCLCWRTHPPLGPVTPCHQTSNKSLMRCTDRSPVLLGPPVSTGLGMADRQCKAPAVNQWP